MLVIYKITPPAPVAYKPKDCALDGGYGLGEMKRLAGPKGTHPDNQPFVRLAYLAVEEASKKWIFRHQEWAVIYSQLMIYFGERLAEQV
jgi:hypothetical protein